MTEKETEGEREWYRNGKNKRGGFWVRKREETHFITVQSCPGTDNIHNGVDKSQNVLTGWENGRGNEDFHVKIHPRTFHNTSRRK
jgi:hypothetical protein